MSIRILIVDDHSVVRQGLRMFLAPDPELEVVGEAADGAEALRLARALQPDVVIMDLLMPVMDGITATARIHEDLPAIAVIVLTSALDEASIVGSVRAGAQGYLLKDMPAERLREAVRGAAEGQMQLAPQAASRMMREFATPHPLSEVSQLTERETDVLRLLAAGQANKQIALHLNIAEKTVKIHVSSILAKLGVRSRTQAALYAVRTGLVVAGQVAES